MKRAKLCIASLLLKSCLIFACFIFCPPTFLIAQSCITCVEAEINGNDCSDCAPDDWVVVTGTPQILNNNNVGCNISTLMAVVYQDY